MPYSRLLKMLMNEKNVTSKELAEKSKINATYISKILNNKQSAPSDEISRKIAKVLNINEKILIIEGYIDKAPKEILELINLIRDITISTGLRIASANKDFLSSQDIGVTYGTLIKELGKEPISYTIIDILEGTKTLIESGNNLSELVKLNELDKNDFKAELVFKNPFSMVICDNGMFPLIEQNSRVVTEINATYNNGDIICVSSTNGIIARQLYISEKYLNLIPLNKNGYESKNYSKDTMILGKVTQIIKNL